MRVRGAMWAVAAMAAMSAGCSPDGGYAWPERSGGAPGQASATTQPGGRLDAERAGAEPLLAITDSSSLPDYLALAGANNPGLEAAFARWKAALERIPQEKALPDPQFSYRYFIIAQAMRDGDVRDMYQLSQAFPWLEKLALRGDIAAQDANAERQRYEAARLKLFNRVKQAYYDYSHLARTLTVTRENLKLLEYLQEVAQARYRTAGASQPDVVRAQVEVGKLANELRTLEDLRVPTVARLNAAMNRPPDAPLPWPKDDLDYTADVPDAQLLAWLAEGNPELKAMEFEIAARRRGIELARKDYLPEFMVGVEFDRMVRAVPDMSPESPLALMLTVSLPIWREKYAAGVREANSRHVAAIADRQEAANGLSADLKLAAYQYRDAQRRVRLYGEALVPKAREALRAAEGAYRAGAVGFTDLIDAQRVLLDFQLEYHRALTERAQRLADLEMMTGQKIPRRPDAGATSQPTTRPQATTLPQ